MVKQGKADSQVVGETSSHAPEELLARVNKHDKFYSRMINLIPRDLYLHSNSAAHSTDVPSSSIAELVANKKRKSVEAEPDVTPSEKYYKHRKLPLTADERKVRSQQNKKAKYSAENAKVEGGSDAESMDEEEEEAPEAVHPSAIPANTNSNVKIEELRKRLQERISNLKNQRLPTKKKPAERPQLPKKPSATSAKKVNSETNIEDLKALLAFQEHDDGHSVNSSVSMERHHGSADPDIEFGHVVDEEKELRTQPVKRDGGKVMRIKKLLQEAERKRERLQSLASSKDDADQRKAKSEQWQDVLKSAAGEKIMMVDPSAQGLSRSEAKLKKALKRHEKKKQKSADEWGARLDKVKDDKEAKQQKREDNLKTRKLAKHGDAPAVSDKKNAVPIGRPGGSAQLEKKKDERTEGKGRNRAGFEGKKASFLNANK